MEQTNSKFISKVEQIHFPYKGGVHKFQPEQIIRLQADSNYTHIYLIDQKHILMATVLRTYESILRPFGFIRTHRSHLVNKSHVKEIQPGGTLMMQDESCVEISRRKKASINKLFESNFQTLEIATL
jgi:two-component system LytT family response regulator